MQQRTYSTHRFSDRAAESKPHPNVQQSHTTHTARSTAPSSSAGQQSISHDELSRIFNTALVSTQAVSKKNLSAELYELTQGSAFKAILSGVRQLSRLQGISERQAAEQVIKTFRKMDTIWEEYISQEGLDQLKRPKSS